MAGNTVTLREQLEKLGFQATPEKETSTFFSKTLKRYLIIFGI